MVNREPTLQMSNRTKIQEGSAAWRVLILAASLMLTAGPALSQSVSALWSFSSGTFPAGQEVRSVSSVNVGTDGSVAVTLTTDDGSFGNTQYKLYWVGSDGSLIWASQFLPGGLIQGEGSFPVALTIRSGLLIYQVGDTTIKSVVKPADGPAVVGTVATADTAGGNTFATYSIEQSRTPGVFAVVEVEGDGSGFTLQMFKLTAAVQGVTLVGSETGVRDGRYVLQFQSQDGVTYQIQASTDLLSWVNQGPVIVGDGGIKSLLEPVSATTRRFFRVVVQ